MSKHQRSAGKAPKTLPPKSTRASGRRVSAKPGPGRPTAERVEAINRAILLAARSEFDKSGYDDTRMEAIAEAAGVSKGTLYDRYPTKEMLLRAVIARHVAAWSGDWGPDSSPVPADLRQRLKHRAHKLMEFYCSGQIELLDRLFNSSIVVDDLRRMRHEVGHQRTTQIIAQDIIDRSADRPVRPRTALRLAEMLMGMLYGWWRMHQEIRSVTLEEALAFADHAVDVLLDGHVAWAGARSAR